MVLAAHAHRPAAGQGAEFLLGVAFGIPARPPEGKHHIHVPVFHQVFQRIEGNEPQHRHQVGFLHPQPLHGRAQHPQFGGVAASDDHPGEHLGAELLHPGFGQFGQLEDLPRVLGELKAFFGQAHALAGAPEQFDPQFILQGVDLVLNPTLSIISILTAVVMVVVAKNFSRLSGRYYVEQQKNLGIVDGFIEEMLDGQKVVKVFCHEEAAKADFHRVNEALRDSADKANRYANLLMPVNGNIGWLSYAIVAVVGAILGINGMAGVTLGTVITFVGLNKSFTQPITQISTQLNFVVNAAAGAQRVFDLMDQTPEKDEGYVELVDAKENDDGTVQESKERTNVWAWKHPHKADGTVTYAKLEGGVVFDDVDFGYDENKMVLHNISLWAKPGQKIAFVGATGAGKTTITNLINRFYDIADGKIRYDGININKIKKPDLRRSLGIVLQDTHLFTGTVMENIRYGRLEASDEECIAAAKLANADGFIRRLPDGYNTMLTGDGANLSQGQRQLLAIARATVADPPVLILDEATSSIDTRTEKLVQDGMDALMYGRTTFVIAHRLSTVRNADCIMVMDQGRIIERGTHDELIAKKGMYYRLYTGNFADEPA